MASTDPHVDPASERALPRALALGPAIEAVDAQVAGLSVDQVPVAVCDQLAKVLVRHERRVAALRTALVRRVTEAGFHERHGGRDPATHLATLTGTSVAKARAELDLAARVERLPLVHGALRRGELSIDQARIITPVAEAAPRATEELLEAARTTSLASLRTEARTKERAARGEAALCDQERRVHERRYCRTFVPETGGVRLEAWLTTLEGAKVLCALDQMTAELLATADEAPERVRADALVALVTGSGVRAELSVRVDAAALVRGEVEAGEACEVPGIGPVSVAAARSLLGEAFCTLLVTKGADVATVTSTTRFVPRKVRAALEERDRCCVVPGCGATLGLELDHWRYDFEKGGPTELANLCRLCSVHHRQKTQGILVLGGGPGKWWTKPGRMAAKVPGPSGQARRERRERELRERRERRERRELRERAGPPSDRRMGGPRARPPT